MVAKPLRDTLLHADIQYLDAKNDSFIYKEVDSSPLAGLLPGTIPPSTLCPNKLNGSTYTIDCSNMRALRSPLWTINLGAQQSFDLNGNLKLTIEVSTHYQTSSIVMFERRPYSTQGAYWTSDAAVSVGARNSSWTATFFINNISDSRILTNAYYNSFSTIIAGNYSPPRTYGARLQFKF